MAKRRSIRIGTTSGPLSRPLRVRRANRLISTTYPDGEIVYTDYDQTGQPLALRNAANESYSISVNYDLFGRVTRIEHGNRLSTNTYYYGQSGRRAVANGHRLMEILTQRYGASRPYLAFTYPPTTPAAG